MAFLVWWSSTSTIEYTYSSIHSSYMHTNYMCIYVDLFQCDDRFQILDFDIRNYESMSFLVGSVTFPFFCLCSNLNSHLVVLDVRIRRIIKLQQSKLAFHSLRP